ncbi:hypothetical protein P3T22_003851 [Paraburkholderia sp. GAS348]
MLNQRRNVTRSCFYRARTGSRWFTPLCRKPIRVVRPVPVIKYGTERRQLRRIRTCAKLASMLAGIQQRPSLPRWRPGKDSRKHRAASNAGVVLFHSRIFHRAGAVEREVLVRKLIRRLAGKVSAWRAGLNPKVHSSVVGNFEQHAGMSMLVESIGFKPRNICDGASQGRPFEVSASVVTTPSKTNNESMSFAVSPQTGCRCLSLRY